MRRHLLKMRLAWPHDGLAVLWSLPAWIMDLLEIIKCRPLAGNLWSQARRVVGAEWTGGGSAPCCPGRHDVAGMVYQHHNY